MQRTHTAITVDSQASSRQPQVNDHLTNQTNAGWTLEHATTSTSTFVEMTTTGRREVCYVYYNFFWFKDD